MDSDTAAGSRPNYVSALKRQWFIVVGSAALGLLVALLLLSSLSKAYASSASVLVEPTNSNSISSDSRTVGVINMDTEAQIVKSLPVTTAVKTATNSPLTAQQLSKQVTVSVPANTTILQIGFQGTSAAGAQAVAQAFANAYIDFRTQQSADMINAQARKLDKQAQTTVSAIGKLNQRIALLTIGSAARAGAEQNLGQLRSRLKWIDQQLQPLQAQPVAAGSVIVSAPLNSAPVKPSKVLVGGSSVALFGLLGILLAWWRDGRQGRIRGTREIEQDLDLAVLGVVDDVPSSETQSHTRSIQQYRQVVHAAMARLGDDTAALLVTGVGAHSMAEEVAGTLSAELARTGNDVRLLYSDERAAEIFEHSFRDESAAGSIRLTSSSLATAQVTEDGDVADRDLPSVLERSAAKGRYEVLATPPTGLSADAQAIAPHAKFTLLVITLNQSTRAEVVEALRQLRQVGVTNVGAVVIAHASRKERSRSRALAKGRQRWLDSRASADVVRHSPVAPVAQPTTPAASEDVERVDVAEPSPPFEDSEETPPQPDEAVADAGPSASDEARDDREPPVSDETSDDEAPSSEADTSAEAEASLFDQDEPDDNEVDDATSDESSEAHGGFPAGRGSFTKRRNGTAAKLPSVPIKRTR